MIFFFFQAEDGIRDDLVTGVQTCALPISGIPLVFEEAGAEGIEHTYVPPTSIPSLEEAVAKYFENFLQAFPASELPSALQLLRHLADTYASAAPVAFPSTPLP